MKAIDAIIQVPSERIVTLKVPDDILPGKYHALLIIEENTESSRSQSLFNPEGLWSGQGTNISPEDMAEARKEMWGKFDNEDSH